MKLGKAQSTIANKLRLLRLTADEREIILKYNLTERHARALLRLAAPSERLSVLEKVVKLHLNVEKNRGSRRKSDRRQKNERELPQAQQGVSKCSDFCQYHHKSGGNDAGCWN